jgi:hypothetical protein
LKSDISTLKEQAREWKEKCIYWKNKSYEWEHLARPFVEKSEGAACHDYNNRGGEKEASNAPVVQACGVLMVQALFLQAAIDRKQAHGEATKWGRLSSMFVKKGAAVADESVTTEVQIRDLIEQNASLEDSLLLAKLRSEMGKIQSAHKKQAYNDMMKVEQLELELENKANNAFVFEKEIPI